MTTITLKLATNIVADLIAILILSILVKLSRRSCIALLPGSVAATVNVNMSRRLNKCIAVAITIVIIANILKGVLKRFIYGVFEVARPVSGKLTLNTSSRTVKATGTVRVNRVRNTVDSLTVTITKVLAIIFTSIFTGFC